MVVKKSLKQLAIVSGSVTTLSCMERDIEPELLDFIEIKSRTPDQILHELSELRLKYGQLGL